MSRPDLNRVPEFYHNYINLVEKDDLITAMKDQTADLSKLLENMPIEKKDYAYAPGKWTLKQLLQHIVDAERIFAYRALCFARKDSTPLPSFDEDSYANNAKTENRSWESLVEEFKAVRRSTEIMFQTFDNEQLESSGTASGKSNYVLAIGFTIVGHLKHHVNIMKERYLQN
jgi:uncharacterized damage-inducible protein DinB